MYISAPSESSGAAVRAPALEQPTVAKGYVICTCLSATQASCLAHQNYDKHNENKTKCI